MKYFLQCKPTSDFLSCHPPNSTEVVKEHLVHGIYIVVETNRNFLCGVLSKDIVADALMVGLTTAKDVPYFDGDFWPNTLEEAIAEEEKEKNIEDSVDSGTLEVEVRACCVGVIFLVFLLVFSFVWFNISFILILYQLVFIMMVENGIHFIITCI